MIIDKRIKFIIASHVAIILVVLGISEPFDNISISQWIMMFSLCLMLIYYLAFFTIKKLLIPNIDILIAFCSLVIWCAMLFTFEYWSNIAGFDQLVYFLYALFIVFFFICLLLMNLLVFLSNIAKKRKNKLYKNNDLNNTR